MLSLENKSVRVYRRKNNAAGKAEELKSVAVFVQNHHGTVSLVLRGIGDDSGDEVEIALQLTAREAVNLLGDMARGAYRIMED